MSIYLIFMYAVSLITSYFLVLNTAERKFADSILPSGDGKVLHAAIAAPGLASIALVVYAIALGGIGYGWYVYGAGIGTAFTIGFMLACIFNKNRIMPTPTSEHFRRVILFSMLRRYADFTKQGDSVRAAAMAELLEMAGVPVRNS